MTRPRLEICVDSLEGALRAEDGGASRLELCSSLHLDGLSPSDRLLESVLTAVNIPVMVMVRPRPGDFVFNAQELEQMKSEIEQRGSSGCAGFVFGNLSHEEMPEQHQCRDLKDLSGKLDCTFHRAFDICTDQFLALEQIINLGFSRILTSGNRPTAGQGKQRLKELIEAAGDRIQILPGGKIRPENAKELQGYLECLEFHSSATEGWR
jgi:copper homeostasis protein|tara:strand:+ start:207 stop:833 length:627 start_codon:yes stop_codon:yes gene_type:complete